MRNGKILVLVVDNGDYITRRSTHEVQMDNVEFIYANFLDQAEELWEQHKTEINLVVLFDMVYHRGSQAYVPTIEFGNMIRHYSPSVCILYGVRSCMFTLPYREQLNQAELFATKMLMRDVYGGADWLTRALVPALMQIRGNMW